MTATSPPSPALPQIIGPGDHAAFGSSAASLGEAPETAREWLDNQLRETGALLFRGFDIGTVDAFEALAKAAGNELIDYKGGTSPRNKVNGQVYISTYVPRHLYVPLHNEMCYLNRIPRRIFFGCLQPANQGGQTPLADMAAVVEALDDSIVEEFDRRGVQMALLLPAGKGKSKSRQEMFAASDPDEAEAIAVDRGYSVGWRPKNSMRISRRYPALIEHPHNGRRIWFNQTQIYHPSYSVELRHDKRGEDRAGIAGHPPPRTSTFRSSPRGWVGTQISFRGTPPATGKSFWPRCTPPVGIPRGRRV